MLKMEKEKQKNKNSGREITQTGTQPITGSQLET